MNKIIRFSVPLIVAFLFIGVLLWLVGESSYAVANPSSSAIEGSILVTTLDDELNNDGDCSLREAIEAANTNSEIDACPAGDAAHTDTITFDGAGIITITSQLSVTNGGPLVIDAGDVITTSGGGTTRVWWVERESDLTLQNLAVMNGYVGNDNGAGLYNDGASLTIDHCDFVGNHFSISDSNHYYGGGVYSLGGTLNIFDSRFDQNGSEVRLSHGGGIASINTAGQIRRTTFQNNTSVGCLEGIPCTFPGGGGIYLNNASITIMDSKFISNTSLGGGGLYNEWGPLAINDSTFSGNSGLLGGGIANNGIMTITNSTFFGNNVNNAGGGIYNFRDMKIVNSIFSSNNGDAGGGIYNNGSITITNSTFSGNLGSGIYNSGNIIISNSTLFANEAAYGGGIMNLPRVPFLNFLAITNCTFTENHATNYGGGLYNVWMDGTIVNSTFSSNSAGVGGGGIYNDVNYFTLPASLTLTNTIVASSLMGGDCAGTIIDGGYNLNTDDTCGFDPTRGSLPDTDPRLGPLQDNGGSTWTHALLSGSPAIDAGNYNQCPNIDQRGFTRPMDGNGDGIPICDIGSLEMQSQPIPFQIFLTLIINSIASP